MHLETKTVFRSAVFGSIPKSNGKSKFWIYHSRLQPLVKASLPFKMIIKVSLHIVLNDFSFASAFHQCCSRKVMFLGATCLPNAQMITLRSSPPYQNDLWVCEVQSPTNDSYIAYIFRRLYLIICSIQFVQDFLTDIFT